MVVVLDPGLGEGIEPLQGQLLHPFEQGHQPPLEGGPEALLLGIFDNYGVDPIMNRLLNGLRSRAFKSIELSRGFPAAEDYGDCKVPTAANVG